MNDDADKWRAGLERLRKLSTLPPDAQLRILLNCARGNAELDRGHAGAQMAFVKLAPPVNVRRIAVRDWYALIERAPLAWRPGEALAAWYHGTHSDAATGVRPMIIAFAELPSGDLLAEFAIIGSDGSLGPWCDELAIEWFQRALAGVKSRLN